MDKLLILGAGGHGRVIADIALRRREYRHIAFLDDDESILPFEGIEVIGPIESASRYIGEYEMIVAMGENWTRKRIQCALEARGGVFPVLTHPGAIISASVVLGQGTVVMAGAILNCGSHVGRGSIVNTAAVIDHDGKLGEFVHLSPGACLAGGVTVGDGTWIGTGAHISDHIAICGNCVIGVGAAVVRNIDIPGTYIGVPVKKYKSKL